MYVDERVCQHVSEGMSTCIRVRVLDEQCLPADANGMRFSMRGCQRVCQHVSEGEY